MYVRPGLSSSSFSYIKLFDFVVRGCFGDKICCSHSEANVNEKCEKAPQVGMMLVLKKKIKIFFPEGREMSRILEVYNFIHGEKLLRVINLTSKYLIL